MNLKTFATVVSIFYVFASSGQSAIVSGQITNPTDKIVYLRHYSDFITYNEITVDSALLNKKGEFRMEFPWTKAGNLTFYHGEEITEMYVCPGDDIKLTLDTREFDESIRYTGEGAVVNTYMALKYFETPPFTRALFMYLPEAFAAYMDSVTDRQLAFATQYFSNQASLEEDELQFFENEKHSLRYSCASQKLTFPMMHGYVTGKRDFKADPGYYAFLEAVPLSNETATSSDYYEFTAEYIQYVLRNAEPGTDLAELRKKLIDTHWKGYSRDYLYATWIYNILTETPRIEEADSLFQQVKPAMTSKELIAMLEANIEAHRALAPGNPAPAFTATRPDGKSFASSDFLGNVVYLDIWATWCGPCVGEIPAMEKLISEMDGSKIVFLSISVDTDEKSWQTMLKKKSMKGTHGIAPGNFNSPIAKAFRVDGIPRYVIIDQAGNIANPNAPRPGQVKEELEALLNR